MVTKNREDVMNFTIVKAEEGYANFLVYIDRPATGRPDLWVNTQYGTINADNEELIPADKDSLFVACRNIDVTPAAASGSTTTETAAHEVEAEGATNEDQDRRNAKNSGYCPKCHTYCYGDCES